MTLDPKVIQHFRCFEKQRMNELTAYPTIPTTAAINVIMMDTNERMYACPELGSLHHAGIFSMMFYLIDFYIERNTADVIVCYLHSHYYFDG